MIFFDDINDGGNDPFIWNGLSFKWNCIRSAFEAEWGRDRWFVKLEDKKWISWFEYSGSPASELCDTREQALDSCRINAMFWLQEEAKRIRDLVATRSSILSE